MRVTTTTDRMRETGADIEDAPIVECEKLRRMVENYPPGESVYVVRAMKQVHRVLAAMVEAMPSPTPLRGGDGWRMLPCEPAAEGVAAGAVRSILRGYSITTAEADEVDHQPDAV